MYYLPPNCHIDDVKYYENVQTLAFEIYKSLYLHETTKGELAKDAYDCAEEFLKYTKERFSK